MGHTGPIRQFVISLVISDQYQLCRLLTIFIYIFRCVLLREACVGGWTRRLTVGMGIWMCAILGIREFVCIKPVCMTYVFCGMGLA